MIDLKLSDVEQRLAALYADTDLSPAEVAAELGLTPTQFDEALYRTYWLLQVRSRQQLRHRMLTLELAAL